MKPQQRAVFSLIVMCFCCSVFSHAQNWSGILDQSRAVDWSNAGIASGIPARSTQCGATIAAYSGSATAINSAIASCGSGQYVHLGTGTFNLSSGISFAGHSNVTLRGDGPLKTILVFSSGSFCYSGNCDVQLGAASNVYDGSSSITPPCGGSNGSNCATWSGGYAKGTTQITLTSVGSNAPAVGTLLILDQANDTSDPGGIIQCDNASAGICAGNGGSFGRTVGGVHYSQEQIVRVTAISGSTYTITPGVYANNIRSSQSPGAWWNSGLLTQSGIENLTLDHSHSSVVSGEVFYDCYQCWMKNVRSLNSGRNHVWIAQSSQVVVRDSYIFGVQSGGGEESYGVEAMESSDSLIENNIFDQISSPIMFDDVSGFVVGFNFSWNNVFSNPNWMQTSYPSHDAGNHMNLFEGNYFNALDADNQHGNSPLTTVFRNWLPGQQPAPYNKTEQTQSFGVDSKARAWNIVGNVLGTPGYHTVYENSPLTSNANCNFSIYAIGWAVSGSACAILGPPETVAANDPSVVTSMMRWGNYDTVHASVQWNSKEVPTAGITFVNANPVPASHTLPMSFYYNAKPSWWSSSFTTPPFPPVGPDVSGGQGPGGFAYQNLAYLCFANGSFSNGILNFDGSNCYSSSSTNNPPAPPTGLSAVVQ
jgi:hypothetical protein